MIYHWLSSEVNSSVGARRLYKAVSMLSNAEILDILKAYNSYFAHGSNFFTETAVRKLLFPLIQLYKWRIYCNYVSFTK